MQLDIHLLHAKGKTKYTKPSTSDYSHSICCSFLLIFRVCYTYDCFTKTKNKDWKLYSSFVLFVFNQKRKRNS